MGPTLLATQEDELSPMPEDTDREEDENEMQEQQ